MEMFAGSNQSCSIRCYFENGRVAALKGLFNVLNNNKLVLFFDILTHDMSEEIDRVFDMISLALIFSERHLNLKMIILTSFSFRSVSNDVTFKFHNSVLTQMLIS